MLEVMGIGKSLGGLRALSDVHMTVYPAEIRGLIGPNGAGKSSLVNVVSGLMRPDAGTVVLNGTTVSGRGPEVAARTGIGRTFQNLRLFPSLTVAQNVEVALQTARHARPDRARHFDIAAEIAALGLDV
jgi:branched-chain amino acid transport system ATP-binding protein